MDKIRESAARVLSEVLDGGAYANVALPKELRRLEEPGGAQRKKTPLAEVDRRFLTELVYGATKTAGTLDFILGKYMNRPLAKVPPMVRSILRLAAYQIFFMDKVPPSAAVNEAVEFTKHYSHVGTVKFVNAVLRTAVREPQKAKFPAAAENLSLYLSLKFFHPLWLVEKFLADFGEEETRLLLAANNIEPSLILRANTVKISREDLLAKLVAENVVCEPSALAPEGIICTKHDALANLSALADGLATAQDESSMLTAHVIAPQAGAFIIDACAAPGGKATHLAALMNNRGRVVACDVSDAKLKRIADNAARLGTVIVEPLVCDGRRLGEKFPAAADVVLVDAPCSGLGVLRRKADLRHKKTPADLVRLPQTQSEILAGAAKAVKPGGMLVYSTCTINAAENDAVTAAFLRDNEDFALVDARQNLPQNAGNSAAIDQKAATLKEALHFYPHRDKTDGFFIAKMIRRA